MLRTTFALLAALGLTTPAAAHHLYDNGGVPLGGTEASRSSAGLAARKPVMAILVPNGFSRLRRTKRANSASPVSRLSCCPGAFPPSRGKSPP